jgi:hypothetical protein
MTIFDDPNYLNYSIKYEKSKDIDIIMKYLSLGRSTIMQLITDTADIFGSVKSRYIKLIHDKFLIYNIIEFKY